MSMHRRLINLLFLASSLLPAATTVLDGVYSNAQATRGQTAYEANCASCHQTSLDGNPEAPPLKGSRFLEVWRDDYLDALYTHIQTRMPRRPGGEPGSLTDSQYLDIVAWILKVNEYPAGPGELAAKSLPVTLLTGSDGPKPLPTNALVEVVGCLSAAPNDNWTITDASEPVRARDAEHTSPTELKRAGAVPLGTHQFALRLQTLVDNRPDFKPAPLKGRKVQVKGVLTWQARNDRITVLSLEPVAPSCGQ